MNETQALVGRQQAAVPRGVATKNIFVARAQNAEIWDVEGRRYIDFGAGIAVLNTGHRHPQVMAAVARQLEAFTHTCFHVTPYESYLALAERLNALMPGDFPKKTLFVTTGAEAVENAIKIARYSTRRSGIVAFSGGFHGRTHMGMALTGKVMPYKRGFGPFPAEIYHVPYPSRFRNISTDRALEELSRLLRSDIEARSIAAFIVEPVQGEGGFTVASPEFLRALRAFADEQGILLIADEIQTGVARTGRFFAVEHAGVVPDLITVAKGLGGGFPLAGVIGRASIMDAVHPGGLGGTFAGHPAGVAAAHAVLDVIESEQLCARALRIGERLRRRMESLSLEYPGIGDVRGLGAMVALEMVTDSQTREPDAAATARIVSEAQKRGLVLLSCGEHANVLRLLPPLTISDDIVDEGLDILADAVRAVLPRKGPTTVAA